MDAVHSGHCDPLYVLLPYPHVGALDGHGDAAVHGAETGDDLQGEQDQKTMKSKA